MIGEDYVSYETAQLLKSKGFDELCYACYEYFSSGVTMYSGWPFEYKGEPVHNTNNRVKCPTLQMAMKWLRETHNCVINVNYIDFLEHGEVWSYTIINKSTFAEYYKDTENSYKLACEEAIKYCLEKII